MKGIIFLIAFSLVTLVFAANDPIPPGGHFPNTDHSDVEKALKDNLNLLKNEKGEQETGLT